MKYILEIKPEYENSFKGVMLLGAKDSNLFVDTLAVDNLEELNSDYINEHYGDLQDTAYQKGINEGYQRGLEDGKAQVERGCEGCKYEGRTSPCSSCARKNVNDYWTAKDDKIVVGDEVVMHGADAKMDGTGVITWIRGKSGYCNVMWGDGSIGEWAMSKLTKTGRHFDIASILKEMQS